MPRCAIYARFSSELQSVHSCEDQVALCRARAEREGWTVVEIYTDVAISGASNRRPGMTAMLSDAAGGTFDIVCAEALDRVARDQEDIAGIYKRLTFAGIELHTLSDGRVDELHIGLKGTMSALFLKDLADKIRRGQRGTVQRGRMPGGLTYGYDVVSRIDDRGQLDRGLRSINPDQAAVVMRIYQEYDAGRSPKLIAHGLNDDGIPAPRGGDWQASAINGSRERGLGVLHNPIYAGRYLYNRVRMVRDPDTRKRVSRVTSADDRLTIDMPELRIVPEDLWQRVQEASAARSTGPIVRQRRSRFLLSGLIFCGVCGGSYTVATGTKLACSRHREKKTCDNGSRIDRPALEARVLSGLSEQLLAPEAISLLVSEYHAEVGRQIDARRRERAALTRRLRTANRAVDNLVAAIANGASDFREIREALAARRRDRDEIQRQCEEHDAENVIALNPAIVEQYRRRVRDLARSLAMGTADVEVVASRVRDLIERINLTPGAQGGCDVEVVSSLGSVVALATETKRNGRSDRMTKVVAKEGFEPPTPGL